MTPYNSDPEHAIVHHRAELVDPVGTGTVELSITHVSPGNFLGGLAGNAIEGARASDHVPELRLVEDLDEVDDELDASEEADRSQEVFAVSRNPHNYYEIDIKSEVTTGDYKKQTPEPVWELMEEEIEPLVGKTVIRLSSTEKGGGVAMQIPHEINFMREMGIDMHWLVAHPDAEAFAVTKKMHNRAQDVAGPDDDFTEQDAAKHLEFGRNNFEGMKARVDYFTTADVYIFEDPQLVGMLPDLMAVNPGARYIFRNHINTNRDKMAQEGSPQNKQYRYLHEVCGLDMVDTYVAHPVEEFVPYGTKNLAHQPPVSDVFEDLNRPVSEAERLDKLGWLDRQVAKQNRLRQRMNREAFGDDSAHIDDQEPFDRDRRWLTGFARFDDAKGQNINMELQLRIVNKMVALGAPESLIPLTIVAGNGANDDPDRNRVLGRMLELRRTKYAPIQKYITVIGLEHDYVGASVLIGESMYTENFSLAEGWEHRRSESMMKGVPSLSSNAGGLPKQGEDGQGGHVAKLEDLDNELDRIANIVIDTILNPEKYAAKREATKAWVEEFILPELTTVPNVIRDTRIMNGRSDETWLIREMLEQRAAADEHVAA